MNPAKRHGITGGTLFTIAMRWTDRLIGLVSTLILARLLMPADFGIIAMATLVIALADVLLDLGVNIALVRDRNTTQAHFDTAWTLRLIQTTASTALIIILAPYAAEYFGDTRVTPVLQLLAFSMLLAGFENIGIVAFHKQMQFGAEFRFLFLRRIFGFILTIGAAWSLQNYWALVIGMLGSRAFGVVLSYRMHPMRPRLSLAKLRELFAVSQWMLIRGLGEFLHNNIHRFIVGRWNSSSVMGAYTIANEISTMPSAELIAPMNRALLPALADTRDTPAEREQLFLLSLGLQALIALPASVGLALVAPLAVPILLGEPWRDTIPLLQILALTGIAHSLTSSSQYLLIVLGRLAQASFIIWAQVAVFIILAITLIPGAHAEQIALLRLGVTALSIILTAWAIRRYAGIGLLGVVRTTYRPILATICLAGILISIDVPPVAPPLALLLQIFSGAVAYTCTILVLWTVHQRPAGAEAWLINKLAGILKRRQQN